MLAAVLAAALLAGIPPLTPEERTRLETAFDGRDHREEAFAALLDNARRWTGSPGHEPLRLAPDLDALLADPDAFRGDLCRIAGAIQQRTRLERPFHDAWEWFVRDGEGRPVIVYVAGLSAEEEARFADGERIAIDARFYKRVDAVARDGAARGYPAFVGAHPALARGGGGPVVNPIAIAGALLAGLAIVVALLAAAVRRRRSPARARRAPAPEEIDEGPPLPEDPAEALSELKRRADAGD